MPDEQNSQLSVRPLDSFKFHKNINISLAKNRIEVSYSRSCKDFGTIPFLINLFYSAVYLNCDASS